MFLCLHPLPPSPSLESDCLIPLIYLGTPRQYITFNVQRGPPTTPLTMFGLWGVGSGGTAFDDLVYGFMMDWTMSPAFVSWWPLCIGWNNETHCISPWFLPNWALKMGCAGRNSSSLTSSLKGLGEIEKNKNKGQTSLKLAIDSWLPALLSLSMGKKEMEKLNFCFVIHTNHSGQFSCEII